MRKTRVLLLIALLVLFTSCFAAVSNAKTNIKTPVQGITTSLAVANVSGTTGTSVLLSATLTGGGAVPNKTIAFTVNGIAAGSSVTNMSGVATLVYTIALSAAGSPYTIGATFVGDTYYAGISNSGTLTVTHGLTTSVAVALSSYAILSPATVNCLATASDGTNTWDVSNLATWSITPAAGGSFGAPATPEVYTSSKAGSWIISASYGGRVGSASTLVVNHSASVASVKCSPASATVTFPNTQQYTATAYDAAGNSWDVTSTALFSDAGAGGYFVAGLYTPYVPGQVTIAAISPAVSNNCSLLVKSGGAALTTLLTLDTTTQKLSFGGSDITATGWHQIGATTTSAHITVAATSTSVQGTIDKYSPDSIDGSGTVGTLTTPGIAYYRWILRNGVVYRLYQTTTVGASVSNATYDGSIPDTVIDGTVNQSALKLTLNMLGINGIVQGNLPMP